MADDQDLEKFVMNSLNAGQTPEAVRAAMMEAGWSAQKADKALTAYKETPWGVPVPVKRSSFAARDFAFYASIFLSLYISVYFLNAAIFDILNVLLPQSDTYVEPDADLRRSLATVIVFLPVYIYLAQKADAQKRTDPACRMSGSRQWLTYLTLVMGGLTVLICLSGLTATLLGGESSLRLVLKYGSVLATALVVMRFYYKDIRSDEGSEPHAKTAQV